MGISLLNDERRILLCDELHYLGDGISVGFDGWHHVLSLGDQEICLSPDALDRFLDVIFND